MTKRKDFEAMLEALINEDQKKAKEIFHNIIVDRSRKIYEELLAEEFEEDTGNPYAKEEEGEEEEEESFGSEEEGEEEEGEEEEDVDMDSSDDFDSEEEPEEEGDLEDRVLDLEDALEDLKAEFEELMAGEGSEEEHDFDSDEFGSEEDEFGSEDEFGDEDEFGSDFDDEEDGGFQAAPPAPVGKKPVYEYTQKVTVPKGGDDGSNTKSTVAGPNKMGGRADNFARTGTVGEGSKGGVLNPSPKEENFGNVNTPNPGKKATTLKPVPKGHGADKKGKGEESGVNKKPIIGESRGRKPRK